MEQIKTFVEFGARIDVDFSHAVNVRSGLLYSEVGVENDMKRENSGKILEGNDFIHLRILHSYSGVVVGIWYDGINAMLLLEGQPEGRMLLDLIVA